MLRALVLALAALCAASAVALPLVNGPDVETTVLLPEAAAPEPAGVVIARPAPVRPELAPRTAPRPRRAEPRGSALPSATPSRSADEVRMPGAEPSVVVVAAPAPRRHQPSRLLARDEPARRTTNPNVRVAPDLPADALSEPPPQGPPPHGGSGRKERYAQD